MVQLSHSYMTTGETVALTVWTFVSKVMSLLFNTLSRFRITSIPMSKCLLISWLQSLSLVILEPKKIKSVIVSTFSPCICHEVMGLDAMILVFLMLSFKPAFSLSSFTLIKRLFSSSFYSVTVCISEVIDISPGNLDSSLWFIQPGISHDVLCIDLNKYSDNIQPCHTPFSIEPVENSMNKSVVSCPVLTIASWPTYSFLRGQVR